jgi:signal transduction histidine kinase
MQPKPITHGNIFRVLTAGFGLVMILLLAAALVAVRNIHAIQQSAASLIGGQEVARRLIGELHGQQTSLTEVFSVLARDPDSVDEGAILKQLDTADADTARIAAEGARTPDRDLWARLQAASLAFSGEARHILAEDEPETFAPVELFRDHEDFMTVVARLVEREYQQAGAAQAQLNQRTSDLLHTTVIFAGSSLLLALLFAIITVRMVSRLIRGMEWQTAELGRVSWHMLEDQEATARRFSHELHDELGQALTAIKTNLGALAAGGQSNRERLQDCLSLVDEAIGNVRQMSQLLRPTILDDFGLAASLRWQVEGFAARTGIEARFESNFEGRLPGETETHLFRIAQEALTNVARHAQAGRVTVRLMAGKQQLRLSVEDNGRGLAGAPAEGRGMGLIGMRARARIAGGELTERSQPGQGVLIEVRLPLPDETNSHSAG